MIGRLVGKKVLGAFLTLLFVLSFNFFLFRVVESDPVATLFRGRNLSAEKREELARDFGIDKPLPQQFVSYLNQTAHLNFGYSYTSRQPVTEEIASKVWPTLVLVGTATLLSTVFGILIGISAGWRRGTARDYGLTSFSMVTYAMPDFWLGLLLLALFSATFNWFPSGGLLDPSSGADGLAKLLDQGHHLVLPCLTLTLAYLGEYAIITRTSVLETTGEDYLTLARAKGLRDTLVRTRHAVPNALLPVVTLTALNFGYVLSGAIAVESIFSWPGLGLLTFDSIRGPDLPMLQGLFLFFSAAVIVANLVADLAYALLDPRVRTAG